MPAIIANYDGVGLNFLLTSISFSFKFVRNNMEENLLDRPNLTKTLLKSCKVF